MSIVFPARRLLALAPLSLLTLCTLVAAPARAQSFLDISTLTPGANGSFVGTLNSIPVSSAIIAPNSNFTFTATGTGFGESTVNNSSPQYSYGTVYNPTAALTDRVGFSFLSGSTGTATVFVSFGAPVTNPVFHVANLDQVQFTFSLTGGLTGLSLLRGNGGGGDGLQVVGAVISDANPTTSDTTSPTTPPPTSGGRSGYGSVQLTGTFQTLTFTASNSSTFGDSGSFTFSTAATAPEPATVGLVVLGMLAGGGLLRRRNA